MRVTPLYANPASLVAIASMASELFTDELDLDVF